MDTGAYEASLTKNDVPRHVLMVVSVHLRVTIASPKQVSVSPRYNR